jgi:hypothetical protein
MVGGMKGAGGGPQHTQALLKQLKQLHEQHGQVLAAYERKLTAMLADGSYFSGRAGSGAYANKRPMPDLANDTPEAKKQRLLAEREHKQKAIWDEISKAVEKLKRNAKAEHFRSPVDPIKLRIPDYPQIIKNPMDLGTVITKIKRGVYTEPLEVARDVRRIWENCRLYNGENHVVTKLAYSCSEMFERDWGKGNFEQRWAIEKKAGEQEITDDTVLHQLRYSREQLGSYIAAKDLQEGAAPGQLGPCEPHRDMTFEEKRKLSAYISSLNGEKLERILLIVQEGEVGGRTRGLSCCCGSGRGIRLGIISYMYERLACT